MAEKIGEPKLEFQEGLGPGHVNEVLCKQHQEWRLLAGYSLADNL